ncbi:DUF285 domain-containing protein, partial [Enterococcus faecalis]|nr:DUF285 domain-containing protein [Enterococcus faecalis]
TLTVGTGTLDGIGPWAKPSSGIKPEEVKKINFTEKVVAPQDCSMLFSISGQTVYSLPNLSSIDHLSNLDTSNATSMYGMFYHATSLTRLDLSNFDTSNVTNMSLMFGSSSLTNITFGKKFNTSKVTDMSQMFYYTSSLTNLDLSNFNTSSVTSMYGMFYGATSLTNLDLSNFNTSSVMAYAFMFTNTTNLRSLTLGKSFKFTAVDMGLPDPPNNSDYNGKWRNVGSGTPQKPLGKNLWTADEFMKTYNGPSDEDTYVWQPTGMYIDAVADTFSFPKVHISGKEQTVTPTRNAHLTLTDALPKNASGTQVVVSYETAEDEWQKAGLSLKVSPTTTQTYIQTNETQISSDAAPIITQFDESKKNAATLVDLDLAPKLTVPPASAALVPKDYSTTIDWTIQQGPS